MSEADEQLRAFLAADDSIDGELAKAVCETLTAANIKRMKRKQ